ncbi:MAG: ATP-binding protein, partial [Cystobacter sp.]
VRGGPDQLRFLHDRIQQAAHALLSDEERKHIHLRIGQTLLAGLTPEQLHERLFDVVSQLNAAEELIQEPTERHRLARLNTEAGLRAKESIAHRPAVAYFTRAFSLIPGDPWETDPALTFKVQLRRATCELLSGESAEAERLAEELQSRVSTLEERVSVHLLQNDILYATGRIQEASACMLRCLESLGLPIPAQPSEEEAEAAYAEVWALLGDRPIASLIDLPLMTDPRMKLTMKALLGLFASSYFTQASLLIINLSRMVSLSLRYGFTPEAVSGFSWLGMMAGSHYRQYREGYAFGMLAREFLDRHNLSAQRPKVLFSLQFISYWAQPLGATRDLALEGFHTALQQGELQVASYCGLGLTMNRLAMGDNLDDVYQEAIARGDFARKSGAIDARELILVHRSYVQQMRGRSRAFNTLDSEEFDEESFEAALPSPRSSGQKCTYWITRLKSRYMCGDYHAALAAADIVADLLWIMKGSINILDFHLYRALSLAACQGGEGSRSPGEILAALQQHHHQLAQWAESCPETFRAPERMIFAERARLEGRWDDAIVAYEDAIRAARDNGFIQNVGIASELAANFWLGRRATSTAQAFARDAWSAYQQWGALGKARHLEASWPELDPSRATSAAVTTSTHSTQLDALTVVKAQQAISREIVLERLANTLLQVTIESAGAQRGALLLPQGDTLAVAALSEAAPDEHGSLQALPWTLISYVKRTHEHVLIDDASQPHPFSSDEYLRREGARSVLCLPLMRQEVFCGALYLENDLVTSAFNPGRLALLSHLASQAAIPIENARLYADVQRGEAALRRANDELEQRVEERTRELKEAQARLVDTAREVGMTEVASNVLHSVGNVLTSAVINVEMIRKAVGASRVGRVKQVSALLQEHQDTLADFLSADARGRQLPDYLAELSEELIREQEKLTGDVEEMGRNIEHIRAIVQVQQNYAKTPVLAVECDLSQLIEDALRIQVASLTRHGITVIRELSALPRVQVDKHKLMQILINLISNAKHALSVLPEGQRQLRMRLSAEGHRVRIQVIDNGMGISREIRDRLFEHGFTTRDKGHGFGLHSSGLAAQMLGGTLTLDSEGPGRGATATLELPLRQAAVPAEQPASPRSA